MKNKPVRHKETNTFKFKKFSDRIGEIDVDVFHRVAHRNEEFSDDEESLETNFHKTLKKWNVLNLTGGYTSFRKEVQHVVTLAQLLKHKEQVIDSLTKYLKMKNAVFLQPILDLVVAAAKDLQRDFYQHFPHFLSLIIDLLSTKDPEILEYSFTTLAYLFKFLWRYLIKNIDKTFKLLLPLLVDSKPEYVNNFAAESFAFVARKVRDRQLFLKLVFEALEKTPDGTIGCGKLLFEVISGISGQFHSCAEQMLTLYLNTLMDESIDQQLAFNVIQQIFLCITSSINPKHSQILWTVILKFLDQYGDSQVDDREERFVESILRLVSLIIEHKGGSMLIDPVPLKCRLVKIIETHENSILNEAVNLSVDILLAENLKLTQEISSEFVGKLLSIRKKKILNDIVEKLINHSSFEALILPIALQRSILKEEFGSEELRLFAKVVSTRAAPSLGGINFKSWRKINLDFRGFPDTIVEYLYEKLENWEEGHSVSEDALRTLIILPHINLVKDKLIEILKKNLISLYQQLIGDNYQDFSNLEIEKRAFTFLLSLESLIRLLDVQVFQNFIEEEKVDFIKLIKRYAHVPSILNSLDLFFTVMKNSEERNNYLNDQVFKEINEYLGVKLSSPYGKIRLTVSHIYSLFSQVEELFIEKSKEEGRNLLEILFTAESVETSVYNYRDRLIHLQALTFDSRSLMNMQTDYHDFPLRFLLGNLYINFSLLWDPIAKAIATYATEKCPQFWPIFLEELKKENTIFLPENYDKMFECNVLKNIVEKLSLTDKPDHQNYKVLLWKCMGEFPEYCEIKNRDITVLFIDFVENQVFKSNSETAKSCSIEKRDNSLETTVVEEIESEDEADEAGNKEESPKHEPSKKSYTRKIGRSSEFKLLLAQLNLFAKAQNPKMMYKEAEMNQIYMDLLTSKSSELQKAVLNCLVAYKQKFLLPYKDQLYGLIEEKNLRNELARFKIEHEEGETVGMIQVDHRKDLMPIVMRLMYAKMISRGTGRASGAAGGLVRRKIILRFLMGVKEEEMMLFARMAFKLFEKYHTSLSSEEELKDLRQVTADVMENINLSDVIPPKRLRSAVNLLSIIIEEFGAKMSTNLLPRLLALLLCILAQIKGILNKSENVLSGFIPMMKDLKNTCIGILARFFGHFENYNWSEAELDVLFDIGVFPWIEKLPIEGIHSPTALLKLLSAWSQNPRYFCLLVKHKDDNSSIYCLPFIMKLLIADKTHPSVINTILDMLEKLLTLQDYGTTLENQMDVDNDMKIPLKPRNILEINAESLLPGTHINYGSSILLPHVPDILFYIKRKFQRSKYGINRAETTILARISELNLDPETSKSLVSLSLPILVKRAMKGESEETILELLTTISNLMKNVEEPHVHIRAILPLFSCVSSNSARRLLLQLFETIAIKAPDTLPKDTMIKAAQLLNKLNAMDQRWIEQADFEKRLDAFSEINEQSSSYLTLEFGVAVLHCCYHFLRHETDLSLKDAAGQCLNKLGPRLAKINKENNIDRKFLIEDTILNLVRTGIRSKSDTVRVRSISFLGAMSMECADIHPVLRDLNVLTDKQDPEVDFFENLQHLQLHRRARAFLKFCSISKTLKRTPNSKTLTQFIFPLASSYLCNESFANKNSLIDSAIETVGAVCRLLPWHQYAIILKYYLDKLRSSSEFQRQIVRTVIAILDAFHYDLSKLKTVVQTEQQLEPIIKDDIEEKNDGENEKSESGPLEIEEEEESVETLDEALNKDSPVEDEKIQEDKDEKEEEKYIVEKQTVLSPYAAKGLVFDITNTLMPQLHKAILSRTQHEMSHKVNRRKTGAEKEEEELMRVPIALALVKLLQRLPEKILDKNLPGIFMKLCTFLKSRLDSVRRATREILQKIMITLGPDYLHHLLREMNSLLTKGFQIHVLAYTIHAILISLKPFYKENHINENLQSILQVCKVDLFGLSGEEKDIIGVTKHTSEAKSTKSFDIFHILGQFITESCLIDLLQPLVGILNETRSHKTLRKVIECLRHVVLGLADNNFIQSDKLLIFLYGVVSKSIPAFTSDKPIKSNVKQLKEKIKEPDSFIIPPEPKSRMGLKAIAKTSKDANDHVLLEFALKLLHILLKREKVGGSSFTTYLDSFVPIFADCLQSQHVKLATLSLQCLNWIIKLDLPSVHSMIKEICSSIFKILHKYGAAGLGKGDNFDLVMAAFKTMSVLVRDVKHFEMSRDEMKALILYAEQDLHDYDRQATAFNLLRAIVNRRLIIPEIHEVMNKVSALSVTSESENVRQQARAVFYSFLMEYPLGKDLEKHLSFYLAQLSYEMQPGRMSALNMIFSIVTGFPEKILIEQSGLIFITTGARLVNDDDPECRKLAAKCLKEIITRVSHNQKIKLFDVVMTWFKNYKVSHRTLAAQLCGIFVTVEKDSFESRLKEVLPLIMKQFKPEDAEEHEPGLYVKKTKKKKKTTIEVEDIKDPERLKDHHLFQILQLTLKISANCSSFLKSNEYIDTVQSLAEYSQLLLGYPHLWVRLAATQQIGFVLASLDENKLSHYLQFKISKNTEEILDKGYIYSSPVETLRSLSLDLLAQLQPGMEFEELADQVVKNLVFIARVIKTSVWNNDGNDNSISLLWLVKRVRRCVNMEVTQSPKSTSVRTAAFKWTAGIVSTIAMEPFLNPILFQLMSPLVREMITTDEANAPLRQLSKEVAKMIKKRITDDDYVKLLAKVQQKLDIKRAERKKNQTQQFVIDPELAAKRKIAKQLRKKEVKKRKKTQKHGKKSGAKKPRREIDLDIT